MNDVSVGSINKTKYNDSYLKRENDTTVYVYLVDFVLDPVVWLNCLNLVNRAVWISLLFLSMKFNELKCNVQYFYKY